MLDVGRYASISEIATAEKIDRGYVGSILRLTLLGPEIVEAILDGQQPVGMALSDLLKPFPLQWGRQRAAWAITRGTQVTTEADHPMGINVRARVGI